MPRNSTRAPAIASEAGAVGYATPDRCRWEPNEDVHSVARAITRIVGGHAGIVFVGPTAPVDPADGQLWLDTSATGTGGTGVFTINTITESTTLTTSNTVVLCDATRGPIVVTLPPAAANTGRGYYIKKIDESLNAVTIDGNASETIENELTIVITEQYGVRFPVSDGAEWWLLQEIQMVDLEARATLAQILEVLERIQLQLAFATGADLTPGEHA